MKVFIIVTKVAAMTTTVMAVMGVMMTAVMAVTVAMMIEVIAVIAVMMKRLVELWKPTRWCYDIEFKVLCHTKYRS